MSLLAKSTQMFLSIALRLATNLIVFIILARVWEVKSFGSFMYSYTLSTLIGLVIDYGFGLQLLRDIGYKPSLTRRILSNAIAAKVILVLPVLAISAVVISIPPIRPASISVFLLVLLSVSINSFALLFNFAFRANQRFDVELKLSVYANTTFFALAVITVLVSNSQTLMAAVFVIARLVYLVISGGFFARAFGNPIAFRVDWQSVREMLTSGFPFGVHLALGTLYFQIDTIIVRAIIGDEAVGIYQSAIRLVMGLLVVTEVLSNVYLPSLAAISQNVKDLVGEVRRYTKHALLVGSIIFAVMLLWSREIITFVFSVDYEAASPVIAIFSIVLVLRYLGASYGATLTVRDRQTVRAVGVSIAVALCIVLNLYLVPEFGIIGAAWSSVATHVVLNLIYVVYAYSEMRRNFIDRGSLAMIISVCVVGLCYLVIGEISVPLKAILTLAAILTALSFGITPSERQSALRIVRNVIRPPRGNPAP